MILLIIIKNDIKSSEIIKGSSSYVSFLKKSETKTNTKNIINQIPFLPLTLFVCSCTAPLSNFLSLSPRLPRHLF